MVLYFYRKDYSHGCAREAYAFRNHHSAFKQLDAEVVGISPDGITSHEAFARDNEIPFPLLCYSEGSVRKAYEVKPTLGFIAGRVTFIID